MEKLTDKLKEKQIVKDGDTVTIHSKDEKTLKSQLKSVKTIMITND